MGTAESRPGYMYCIRWRAWRRGVEGAVQERRVPVNVVNNNLHWGILLADYCSSNMQIIVDDIDWYQRHITSGILLDATAAAAAAAAAAAPAVTTVARTTTAGIPQPAFFTGTPGLLGSGGPSTKLATDQADRRRLFADTACWRRGLLR